jgi:hypothetical protein
VWVAHFRSDEAALAALLDAISFWTRDKRLRLAHRWAKGRKLFLFYFVAGRF